MIPRVSPLLRSGLNCCIRDSSGVRMGGVGGEVKDARPRERLGFQGRPLGVIYAGTFLLEGNQSLFLLSYYAEHYLQWSVSRWKLCYWDRVRDMYTELNLSLLFLIWMSLDTYLYVLNWSLKIVKELYFLWHIIWLFYFFIIHYIIQKIIFYAPISLK